MYTLSKHVSINRANTNNVILPHGENHGISLRCLKQVHDEKFSYLSRKFCNAGHSNTSASHLLRHSAKKKVMLQLLMEWVEREAESFKILEGPTKMPSGPPRLHVSGMDACCQQHLPQPHLGASFQSVTI